MPKLAQFPLILYLLSSIFFSALLGIPLTAASAGVQLYSTQPTLPDSALHISESPETGTTWKNISNDSFTVPWIHPGGDWVDSNGVVQGSSPWATASDVNNASEQKINLTVTSLVARQVPSASNRLPNYGWLILWQTGTIPTFYSHEYSDPTKRPVLTVVTSAGTYMLSPGADTALSNSSLLPAGSQTTISISTGNEMGIWFDLTNVSGTVISATLTLTTTAQQYSSPTGTLGLFPVDMSATFAPIPLQLGLAQNYSNDSGIENDPSVLFVEKFPDGNLYNRGWSAAYDQLYHVVGATDPGDTNYRPLAPGIPAYKMTIPRGSNATAGSDTRWLFWPNLGYEPTELYIRAYARIGTQFDSSGGKFPFGFDGTYNPINFVNVWSGQYYNGELYTATALSTDPVTGRAWNRTGMPTLGGNGGYTSNGTNGWSFRGGFVAEDCDSGGNCNASSQNPLVNAGYRQLHYYSYWADQPDIKGSDFDWTNGDLGIVPQNQWFVIDEYVKLNTINADGSGNYDGVLKAWINGRLAYSANNLRERNWPGNPAGANNIKLYSLWLNFYNGGLAPATAPLTVYLSDIVAAKSFIGPAPFSSLPASSSGNGPAVTLAALNPGGTTKDALVSGSSANLEWDAKNATSCSGVNFTPTGTSGTAIVSPTMTTTYTITCTGSGGSATESFTIGVTPPGGLSGTNTGTTVVQLSSPVSNTSSNTTPSNTLTPTTNAPIATPTIQNISIAGPFSQTNTCSGVLTAGAICTITITFSPTSADVANSTLSFSDAIAGVTDSISVTGTGASAVQPSETTAPTNSPTNSSVTSQPLSSLAKVVFLAAGTSWTVPSDWNSASNMVEVIGAGGGGSLRGNGGGGGAYAKISNVTLTPGASVSAQIGAGGSGTNMSGTAGGNGGDTWFNGSSCSGSSSCAKGGSGGPAFGNTGGIGGSAANSIGGITYAGGNGGGGAGVGTAGGGGAAGPQGAGGNGGSSNGGNGTSGNAGGGGAGGVTTASGTNGGAGGANGSGSGAGSSGTNNSINGGAGTAALGEGAGGGGGGYGKSGTAGGNGGNGGNGEDWDTAHGAGGGAGGGALGSSNGSNGQAGFYGGGGASGASGIAATNGASGLIAITYTPAVALNGIFSHLASLLGVTWNKLVSILGYQQTAALALSFSSSSLNFGSVAVGQSATQTITVTVTDSGTQVTNASGGSVPQTITTSSNSIAPINSSSSSSLVNANTGNSASSPVSSSTAPPSLTGAQIQAIINLLESFNADASVISQVEAALAGQTSSTPSSCSFTRNLTFRMSGEDIYNLQVFLNEHGYLVQKTGPGSPGQETDYFGTGVLQALESFQRASNISPAVGFFGPLTRSAVEGMCH